MGLTFANPAGAWILLGLPAVLLIHLLQKKARRVVTSTLFLLGPLPPRSLTGRRLDRLRSSRSLWLQVLVVVVLAWVVADPRFLRPESVQRIVVLLDSSASMSAYRESLRTALDHRLAALSRTAARTEWTLLETALGERTLYSGGEPSGVREATAAWTPDHGTHDFAPAIVGARTIAGLRGHVIFATDHATKPDGVDELLAVGSPLGNVGFVGVEVEGPNWRALVRNYGRVDAERKWWTADGGRTSTSERLALRAGEVKVLSGSVPPGRDALDLVLEPDAFALDDRLPLVVPQPKRLTVFAGAGTGRPVVAGIVSRLLDSWENVSRVTTTDTADLCIVGREPVAPVGDAIVFPEKSGPTGLLRDPVFSSGDPLMDELNWQGLLVRGGPALPPPGPKARVLLWQGTRPLVWLNEEGRTRHLCLGFAIEGSNAERVPAFVLLLHRFVESVRAAKVAIERRNVETGEALVIAKGPLEPPLTLIDAAGRAQPLVLPQAPRQAGFFEVRSGARVLLTGAAHFGDSREGDLSEASNAEETAGVSDRSLALVNSREDPLGPAWLLALAGILLLDWWLAARAHASVRAGNREAAS